MNIRIFLTFIGAAVAAFIFGYVVVGPAMSEEPDVNTAILFMVDRSSSMDAGELAIARESHARGITSEEVLNVIKSIKPAKIAAAYLEFADYEDLVVDWMIISDYESAAKFAELIHHPNPNLSDNGNTGIGRAMAKADEVFEKLPYKALRLVIDIAGDGYNNVGPEPALPRQVLLNRGIVINGLPLSLTPAIFPAQSPYKDLNQYYMHEVIGGRGASLYPLKDIKDMPMIVRQKMAQELF